MHAVLLLCCIPVLLALAVAAIPLAATRSGASVIYGLTAAVCAVMAVTAGLAIPEPPSAAIILPLGLPWIGAHFGSTRSPPSSSPSSISAAPRQASTRSAMAGTRRCPQRVLPFFPRLPRRHEPGRARRRRLHLPVLLGVHVAGLLGAGAWRITASAEQRARRLHLSRHGELRHAGAAAGLRPARRRRAAATPSPRCAPHRHAPLASPRWCLRWRCSAPARRPGWCRCMSGCRSPIPPRRAMSRR